VDRLEKFDKQAKELGITYKRFQAIEATDPKFGCKLSHISALTMSEDPVAFIFEDDSIFVENFQVKFEQAMANIPDDWDMLYLGANLVDTYKVNEYWHKSRRCCSTHAYAVKKKALPKLIESANNYDGHIDMAFSLVHPELNVYLARPTLVYQGPGYSDLQGESVDYSHLYF
jgi:GR25 family glycosyltransferase involved in LPS biosynthesis